MLKSKLTSINVRDYNCSTCSQEVAAIALQLLGRSWYQYHRPVHPDYTTIYHILSTGYHNYTQGTRISVERPQFHKFGLKGTFHGFPNLELLKLKSYIEPII